MKHPSKRREKEIMVMSKRENIHKGETVATGYGKRSDRFH